VAISIQEARKHHDNVLELEINLRQEWTDPRLAYEGEGAVDYIPLTPEPDTTPWMPDTFFRNAEEVHRPSISRNLMRIYPDGKILISKRIAIRTQCHRDLSSFPLEDELECEIRLSSFAHPADDISYHWKADPITLNADELDDFAEYELTDYRAQNCSANTATGNYSCISVYFEFEAPVHNALIYIYIPCLFLLFFSWLQFWLHKSWSVPRTISCVLPFIIFASLMLFAKLPRASSPTALDVWLLFCLCLSFLSFCEYVLCLFLSRRAVVVLDGEKPLLEREDESSRLNRLAFIENSSSSKLDLVSRFLFPLFLIIFLIPYLICYLVGDE